MARPINADTEATQARIFMAASHLFARQGMAATSIRQIASEAGVSLGLIRHYFGSKEELYQACVDQTFEIYKQVGEELAIDLANGVSVEKILERTVRRGFQFCLTHRDAIQLTLQEELTPKSRREKAVEQVFLPFNRVASRLVAPLLGKSEQDTSLLFRTMIVLVMHYGILDMDEVARIIGLEAPTSQERELQTLQAVEEHIVELVLRMAKAPPRGAIPVPSPGRATAALEPEG